MSAAMDKALMALSLDEEENPFLMPELPEFSSCERNALSIIGRILNPDKQKVSDVVFDMPRKWQKQGRVRGKALSAEKFQFIFNSEHDLEEVLDKGFHTHNEWGLVVERWTEFPPPDSLQFVPLWVQIRNIPVNNYTAETITAFGEIIGQVTFVAFDPHRPQNKDYVRVQVRFDVSKPLRKSKVTEFKDKPATEIFFFYERVQKRCYGCQRLSHDKESCPVLARVGQPDGVNRCFSKRGSKAAPVVVLKRSDPLFGVLEEDQVGINPASGRPRIDPMVLDGMRQLLSMAEGEELKIRQDKVRRSVREAERSPFSQKIALSLEPLPIITNDIDKGKGLVFDYPSDESSARGDPASPHPQSLKLMAAAFNAAGSAVRFVVSAQVSSEGTASDLSGRGVPTSHPLPGFTTGAYPVFGEGSGSSMKKKAPRKRLAKSSRKSKGRDPGLLWNEIVLKQGLEVGIVGKRKADKVMEGAPKAVKAKSPLMVPMEGLSNI